MLLISCQKTNGNFCLRFLRHSKIKLDSQSVFVIIPQRHHGSPKVSALTAVQTNHAHSHSGSSIPSLQRLSSFPVLTPILTTGASRFSSQPLVFINSHLTKSEFTGFSFSKLTCRYFIVHGFIWCNSTLCMPGLSLINWTIGS